MAFRFVVISDTHLGEDTSLLGYPEGLRRLWQALRSLDPSCPPDKGIAVDELILLGDVPDRTLSSTSQITSATRAFTRTVGSAVDVKRIVYLPGNHDHSMWTAVARQLGGGAGLRVTPLAGEAFVDKGKCAPEVLQASRDLFSVFLGWPDGNTWQAVARGEIDFIAANPAYAASFLGRTYFFTHGTHFRADVTLPRWLKELIHRVDLDAVAKLSIHADCDMTRATDLASLEAIATPFVDSLWPSAGENAVTASDEAWFLLCAISGKFSHQRATPPADRLFDVASLRDAADPARIARLAPLGGRTDEIVKGDGTNPAVARAKRFMFSEAIDALDGAGFAKSDPISFVFGDTHVGGFGELQTPDGRAMRIWNTGAWVVHNRQDHPPCHIFAVDDAGREFLLDVSFAGVAVGSRTILDLAAEDAEARKALVGGRLRIPPPLIADV